MNGYFDSDGHLTPEAFLALINGEADEDARLEISEHLSFCDQCVLRYTEALSDDLLDSTYEPKHKQILTYVRRRVGIILSNRYALAILSGAAAIALWVGGAFSPELFLKLGDAFDKVGESVSQQSDDSEKSIDEYLSDLIDSIFQKGDGKQ